MRRFYPSLLLLALPHIQQAWPPLSSIGFEDALQRDCDKQFCRFGMEEFSVTINGELTLHLLQAPTAFRGVEHDETGSVVWGASICLARYLTPEIIENQRILELGCGTGIPSLVASKYGAKQVAASDSEDATLQQLDLLAQRNGCPDVELYRLNWKDLQPKHPLERYCANVILASDAIYHTSMVQPLVAAITRYLGPKGKVYIALRNTRQGVPEFWQQAMPEAGFKLLRIISCQQYQQDLPTVFQNEADSNRWRGDHAIYVFQMK